MANSPKSRHHSTADPAEQAAEQHAEQSERAEKIEQIAEHNQAQQEQRIEQGHAPAADPTLPPPLLVPDPLPPLNRPIFEAPRETSAQVVRTHPTSETSPEVEAAIEALRTRLGELREFLKRFPHHLGGELGDLVDYLQDKFGITKPDPTRDLQRREEDDAIRRRREAEDAVAPPTQQRQHRRAEQDAGLAAYRRIQDTT